MSSIITTIKIGFSFVIGIILSCLGGWDKSLQVLLGFIVIDYGTGVLCAIFSKSRKTKTGTLNSSVGFKGLCRKFAILLCVSVAVGVDKLTGLTIVRDATCIGFIINELISILENVGLLGVPLPKALTSAVDILKNMEDKEIGNYTDNND